MSSSNTAKECKGVKKKKLQKCSLSEENKVLHDLKQTAQKVHIGNITKLM